MELAEKLAAALCDEAGEAAWMFLTLEKRDYYLRLAQRALKVMEAEAAGGSSHCSSGRCCKKSSGGKPEA